MASPASEGDSPKEDHHPPLPSTSLHKRRFDAKRGDLPETLTVHARRSLADEPSPRLTPEEWTPSEADTPRDLDAVCARMLRRLEGRSDPLSARSREVALATRGTAEALDHLEKLYELMERLLQLKEHNERALRRARDAQFVVNLADAHRQIEVAMERARREGRELTMQNEALEMDLDAEYGYTEALLESLLAAGRGASVKRAGSRWKAQRLRGSLLAKRRSRSVGGEESEGGGGSEARLSVPRPPKPRRSSEECRKVDASKVSKWTKVKAAFRWEKAHTGVAADAVGAAGRLVGAVALAGTSAPATPVSPAPLSSAQTSPAPLSPAQASLVPLSPAPASAPPTTLARPEERRDSVSVTPGSLLSLTPNSSCEELRMDSGGCRKTGTLRCDENDNTFLQAPIQDDSSTSPSPNKMHKTPWSKMRDIIHTRKESVRRKQRSLRSSGVPPAGRRSFSDGGESDAPPALTVTVPSSEELESEPAAPAHTALRKQRSLELGSAARPPPARRDPARPSKWSKVKRAFLTGASASVPCSPDHHREFFSEREVEAVSSGCEASGVHDEIQRDYAALQSRLGREFSDKRGKLYGMRPVATEEQLSADFRKKLEEWQRMKGGGGGGGSARQPPPVPDRSDLSDDFLKKWDEWKRLKETNSVPTWAEEARPDEVLVQTSSGYIRFKGISRSFTRKLHEWEKARGIAPEASTSALLRAAAGARAGVGGAATPLARAQSAGSVAAAGAATRAHHASSLSVNDADDLEMQYGQDLQSEGGGGDEAGSGTEGDRAAVLVEVEAEEVCTAAPLVAVTPRHMPQTPVYTYDHAEPARLLCETSSAALLQQEPLTSRTMVEGFCLRKDKNAVFGSVPRGPKSNDKKDRRAIIRQPSLEDDAQFIRRTIEEIERGSSNRVDIDEEDSPKCFTEINEKAQEQALLDKKFHSVEDNIASSTSTTKKLPGDVRKDDLVKDGCSYKPSRKSKEDESGKEYEFDENSKRKELMEKGNNGKKKLKARARLEREHSKPSESDSEPDMDTVTVEIPRRRKRPRRQSEKPRTPPPSASAASDTEGEVFVLKLRAPEQQRCVSPEVIVKTKRKIFSPVVRSGENVPRAVVPVDVDELAGMRPRESIKGDCSEEPVEIRAKGNRTHSRKSQEDLAETRSRLQVALEHADGGDDQRPRSRPPLPSSPLSQRRPPSKETAPSIRIMIQRYNLKLNEDGHTSPVSSGASSPAWRSPTSERRRPPDMPNQVNIRNNPFVAREVQKSVSACQLSRQEVSSIERRLEVPATENVTKDGVLKSHSACALHPLERNQQPSPSPTPLREESEFELKPNESLTSTSLTSIETSASATNSRHTSHETPSVKRTSGECPWRTTRTNSSRPPMDRFLSTTSTGSVSRISLERIMSGISRDKRPSVDKMFSKISTDTAVAECTAPKEAMTPSERALRIRAARERFLSSPGTARRDLRDLSGSAGELRPGDRSSRASCSDASEGGGGGGAAGVLGRSASTGMVNVERDAWDRVCEDGGEHSSRRGRFSLARLAARLRRRADPGAVSRLCRQSLLVQLRPQQH